jgi:exosortase J
VPLIEQISRQLAIPALSSDKNVTLEKNSSAKTSYAFSEWLVLASAGLIAGVGLWWMLAPQLRILWFLWTKNGLASIGILVPPTVVVLVAIALRGKVWKSSGSWWGLALCIFTMLLVALIRKYGMPTIYFSKSSIPLFPAVLIIFLYVSGTVLLFAGYEAYRLALFPLSLLLLLNPVPRFVLLNVDLPLQYVGAHTARTFAGWIGVSLASSNLQLMFSPALGMFIAPGCNGLRGAFVMGFLTLIVGYLYRLPLGLRSVYCISGIILAYLLNLVRLCGLVLCYRVALNFDFLARHMEAADYVLGSLIFFTGAVFVFAFPRKWTSLRLQPLN